MESLGGVGRQLPQLRWWKHLPHFGSPHMGGEMLAQATGSLWVGLGEMPKAPSLPGNVCVRGVQKNVVSSKDAGWDGEMGMGRDGMGWEMGMGKGWGGGRTGEGEGWKGDGMREGMGRLEVSLSLTPRFGKGLRPGAGVAPGGGQRGRARPCPLPAPPPPPPPRSAVLPPEPRRAQPSPAQLSPAQRGGQRAVAPGPPGPRPR